MIRSQEMRATSGKERDDSEVMKVPTEREREVCSTGASYLWLTGSTLAITNASISRSPRGLGVKNGTRQTAKKIKEMKNGNKKQMLM